MPEEKEADVIEEGVEKADEVKEEAADEALAE